MRPGPLRPRPVGGVALHWLLVRRRSPPSDWEIFYLLLQLHDRWVEMDLEEEESMEERQHEVV